MIRLQSQPSFSKMFVQPGLLRGDCFADITHTTKSFTEIAVEYGFYDQSHFTHALKMYTGMTPTEFRAATS